MVALIPARAGSKRVPGKNTKPLCGVPLLVYSIAAARASGVFAAVYVCTDDSWAVSYATEVGCDYLARSAVTDRQPDIEWVRDALRELPYEAFAILRPTSPFRTAETIRRAYQQFCEMGDCADSLRAVRPVKEHPYKMWVSQAPSPAFVNAYPMKPLFSGAHPDGTPWHSSPTQTLPTVYVQSSALEMAWTRCVEVHGSISGRKVAPFFGSALEQFSIDTPDDWAEAERLAREDPGRLPAVDVAGVPPVPAA